nr:hypothetical protein [Xenococcaceae cyanobacterium MO_167.B52]
SKKYNVRNNPIHVDLVDNNLNILEYAQRNWTRNVMNKFIHAMKIEDFYFVGIQEFYAEDLRDLQQVMGWSDFEIPVSNKNPDSNYYRQLSEILTNRQLINQLASLNQQDIQLYETAMKIRAERRKEVNLMQYTLAEWSRLQFMLEHMQTQKELQAL